MQVVFVSKFPVFVADQQQMQFRLSRKFDSLNILYKNIWIPFECKPVIFSLQQTRFDLNAIAPKTTGNWTIW